MTPSEQALSFGCADDALVGIVSLPPGPAAELGVVVIVGGPQYRAGSHRQFVLLARALARAGYAVLRFDYRGMGDSTGAGRDFEQVTEDIGAAIDALQQHAPAVRGVALWGLCDGASAALMYCQRRPQDARVRGLCLLNPWVRSATSQARAQVKHYYRDRLRQKDFWRKLLSGQVAWGALRGLWQALRLARGGGTGQGRGDGPDMPFQQRMATGWRQFGGQRIQLILSGNDYTAKEFLEHAAMDPHWRGLADDSTGRRHTLPTADHTFSSAAHRAEVEQLVLQWLGGGALKPR